MLNSGNDLEGDSWFAWTIKRYTPGEIVALAEESPFITLESIPLDDALWIVERLHARLILHVRSLKNWLASSLRISRDRDGETNMPLHRECVETWKAYDRAFRGLHAPFLTAFRYDTWTSDATYRKYVANRLGVSDYDGSPYQRVHGIEYSSFDGNAYDGRASEMDLLHRDKCLQDDPEFQELLKLGATK